MNYFNHAFLLIATIATALFTGTNVNARTADNNDATTGLDHNTERVTNAALAEKTCLVYDDAFIKTVVDNMNFFTPYDAGYGIVVSSITLDQGNININTTCSPLIGMGLSCVTNDAIENSKNETALLFYQILEQIEPDDNGNTFLSVLVDKNIVFNYNFYVDESSKPSFTIQITADYIEHVGDIQNNGYSI